jgi:hypothetical protein
MRSLESHDIPRYVNRSIVETGKIDQISGHQIIWNILATRYTNEDATIEILIKGSLYNAMKKMFESSVVNSYSTIEMNPSSSMKSVSSQSAITSYPSIFPLSNFLEENVHFITFCSISHTSQYSFCHLHL